MTGLSDGTIGIQTVVSFAARSFSTLRSRNNSFHTYSTHQKAPTASCEGHLGFQAGLIFHRNPVVLGDRRTINLNTQKSPDIMKVLKSIVRGERRNK